jgi:hypothetical protein
MSTSVSNTVSEPLKAVPGATYRIYSPDGTSHSTAVCMNNEKILEVKNMNTSTKKTQFDTLEDWRLTYGPDAIVTTDHFAPTDFHGFNVPTERYSVLTWGIWCFEAISRAAPQLLQNEDVKNAYNNHIALCTKYQKSLVSNDSFPTSNPHYWGPRRLAWSPTRTDYWGKEIEDKWMCTYMRFYGEFYGMNKKDPNMTDEVRNELLTSYKALYDLISPTVLPYLKKRYAEAKAKNQIKKAKKHIAAVERHIETYKRNIVASTAQLEKLKSDLVTLEMKKASIN